MPQFDTFSFFSQLFWVFCIFSFFYLSLAYFILPAIAITLKVRKRKMSATNQFNNSSCSDVLTKNSNMLQLNELSSSILLSADNQTSNIGSKDKLLKNIILKNEIVQNFSFNKLFKNTGLLSVFL